MTPSESISPQNKNIQKHTSSFQSLSIGQIRRDRKMDEAIKNIREEVFSPSKTPLNFDQKKVKQSLTPIRNHEESISPKSKQGQSRSVLGSPDIFIISSKKKGKKLQFSKEEIKNKLNYLQEQFYIKEEVFPSEVQDLMNGKTKRVDSKGHSIKNSISQSKASVDQIPSVQLVEKSSSLVSHNNKIKNVEQKISFKQQSSKEISFHSSIIKQSSNNMLYQLNIKSQKQLEERDRNDLEQQLKDLKQKLFFYTSSLQRLKSEVLQNTLFQNASQLELESIEETQKVKTSIQQIQVKIAQMESYKGELMEKLKEKIELEQKKQKESEARAQELAKVKFDSKSQLVIKEGKSETEKTNQIGENQSQQQVKQIQSGILAQLQNHIKVKKLNSKQTFVLGKTQKQLQIQKLMDDMAKFRQKSLVRYKNEHKEPTSLYEQIIMEQTDKKNQIIKNRLHQFLERVNQQKYQEQMQCLNLERKDSDLSMIKKQLAKDNESDNTPSSHNVSVLDPYAQSNQDSSSQINNDEMEQIVESQSSSDSEVESELNDEVPVQLQHLDSESNMKLITPNWKKELDSQVKFLKRSDFLHLLKNSNEYLREKEFKDDQMAELEFIKQCMNSKVVPFPIASKIQDNILNLTSYPIQESQCVAISTLLKNFPSLIGLILIDNFLKDQGLFSIIMGMLLSKSIKIFKCSKNELSVLSSQCLSQLLNKRYPFNLQVLHITDCKMTIKSILIILKQLQIKCHLKELKLVKIGLNNECLEILADILCNQDRLQVLDISWNEFLQSQFLSFLKQIHTCQSLRYLTLSMLPISGVLSYEICEAICSFITASLHLIHLDLSHSQFTPEETVQIGEAIKNSKCLQCLHFSGNQIDHITSGKISSLLKIPVKVDPVQKSERMLSPNKQKYLSQKNVQLIKNEKRRTLQVPLNKEQLSAELNLENKFYNHQNKSSMSQFFPIPNEVLLFQRYLGHCEIKNAYKWQKSKFCWVCEKWQYLVVIYSQKMQIFPTNLRHSPSPSPTRQLLQAQNNHLPEVPLIPSDTSLDRYSIKAQISTSFTSEYIGLGANGDYEDMMELDDFIFQLENNKSTHYQNGERFISSEDHEIIHLKKMKAIRLKQKENEIKRKKKVIACLGTYQKKFQDMKGLQTYIKSIANKKTEHLTDEDLKILQYENIGFDRNKTMLAKLKKLSTELNPFFITNKTAYPEIIDLKEQYSNFDESLFSIDENIFVKAFLVPPGIHSLNMRASIMEDPQAFLEDYNFQVDFDMPPRTEDLEVQYKKVKKRRLNREFNKNQSVFADWKEDTPQLLEKMYQNDLGNLKFSRIVKDPEALEECYLVLKENITKLKDIFVTIIAKSAYPHISWLDFSDFCIYSKIPDKFCTVSKIDMAFIATNVELESNDDNPDRDLNRAEFYEIILRIGIEKFKKSGIVDNFALSFSKVISEHIHKNFDPIMQWNDFRFKHLYTLDLDDVFRLNMSNCLKLFNQFTSFNKRFVTMKEVIYLIQAKSQTLQLPDSLIRVCFAYSKMTVVDEDTQQNKYHEMVFVEFLEFLARIANFVSVPEEAQKELLNQLKEKEEIGLAEKVEYLMDVLFPLVGGKRKNRNTSNNEYINDSDYDL